MRKPVVLIADDDAKYRHAMRLRLSHLGYEVLESQDGLGVLEQSPGSDVDVILLDHGMPNGNGRSIARVIRNETEIPIIFLSGYDRESFRETVMRLPNTYYLPKPVEMDKLAGLLGAVVTPGGLTNRSARSGALPLRRGMTKEGRTQGLPAPRRFSEAHA